MDGVDSAKSRVHEVLTSRLIVVQSCVNACFLNTFENDFAQTTHSMACDQFEELRPRERSRVIDKCLNQIRDSEGKHVVPNRDGWYRKRESNIRHLWKLYVPVVDARWPLWTNLNSIVWYPFASVNRFRTVFGNTLYVYPGKVHSVAVGCIAQVLALHALFVLYLEAISRYEVPADFARKVDGLLEGVWCGSHRLPISPGFPTRQGALEDVRTRSYGYEHHVDQVSSIVLAECISLRLTARTSMELLNVWKDLFV